MSSSAGWTSVTGQSLNLDCPEGFLGKCSSIASFEKLNQLGEGSYGVVHRARELRTSQIVALKKVLILSEERQNGIPITALREISILRSLRNPNVINVVDVAVGERLDEIYMVMEYAEQDLANLLDEVKVKFTLSHVKCLFRQLLEGLDYIHRNDIIHRDMKMQNILLTSKGVLKIADFGMAREYSPRPLTPGIVTIWYRSPELLLGAKHYSLSVDLWSAGLILAELLLCVPCLPGETVIEQLTLIVKLLGTPTGTDLSALSAIGCPDLISWRRESLAQGRVDNIERRFLSETTKGTIEVLKALLKWDPKARWSAAELLGKGRGKYDAAARADSWWEESPREVGKEMLPTFPEVRNKESPASKMPYRGSNNDSRNDHSRSRNDVVGSEPGEMIGGHGGYVFDFDDGTLDRRAAKRHRAR